MDEDKQQFLSRWLPEELSPNVRVVVSMIEGTPTHTMLRAYKTMPKEIICGPLDAESREVSSFSLLPDQSFCIGNAYDLPFVLSSCSSQTLFENCRQPGSLTTCRLGTIRTAQGQFSHCSKWNFCRCHFVPYAT